MKAHEDYLQWPVLESRLEALRQACEAGEAELMKAVLKTCVHGYEPQPDSATASGP